MRYSKLHGWPADRSQAYAMQAELMSRVVLTNNTEPPRRVAACDTAYGINGELLYAAAVVMSFPDLEEIERSYFVAKVEFPYIPGLRYFREGPAVTGALLKLESDPDVIMLNGHGIAHPKRCGLASHIGIAFDLPSIGCARQLLVGKHYPVGQKSGNLQSIRLYGQDVGYAYRSKDNVKPIFISPGYKCDLDYARELVVKCLRGFRLPEPLRLAHRLANRSRQHAEREQSGPEPPESI
ncbi:MAG: endonuclease V [Candidatus Zixiibacteriota bacterium]